jgi:hypothetical protein
MRWIECGNVSVASSQCLLRTRAKKKKVNVRMAFLFKSAKLPHSKRNGFEGNAGVGIVFKSGPDEALFVKSITEGGPAAKSNPPIRVNDCLLKVDGDDVYRLPINKVVDYILGEEDTPIEMTFQRFAGNKLEPFTVTLKRGRPATIRATIDTKSLEPQDAQQHDGAHQNAGRQDAQGQEFPRGQQSHKEKQVDAQANVGQRMEKMRELKNFAALSFTGKGSKEDPTGTYEGDLNQVTRRGLYAAFCAFNNNSNRFLHFHTGWQATWNRYYEISYRRYVRR